ncbi:replication restart DNA helicase PriA [Thermodesulfobium acidiphilum]|uniref:Replication restart protein PriA n=1 Tax=Thermodesulfobium acidiphilum TaxID=1794699 RepID=A0A2R4W137_THEAF|nr:primosomal protein N' [Thermodesulfobium acidiphilum]AWB10527.1 replication restart DNA helicase PriA [Thermodesulfobium acidiphilum]
MKKYILDVQLPNINKRLSYYIKSERDIESGSLVDVPVSEKSYLGIVESSKEFIGQENLSELKFVNSIYEKKFFNDDLYKLYKFICEYYFVTPSSALKLFPSFNMKLLSKNKVKISKKGQEVLECSLLFSDNLKDLLEQLNRREYDLSYIKSKYKDTFRYALSERLVDMVSETNIRNDKANLDLYKKADEIEKYENLSILNDEQDRAFKYFKGYLNRNSELSLVGTTGSGKTEVYLKLIVEVLKKGKNAMLLLPEITLATHFVDMLEKRFPNLVYVWHSQLGKSERNKLLNIITNLTEKIFIGPRSLIFLPINDIGIIIVDEEQSENYKQDDFIRYDARILARERARYNNCPVLYVSATPSVDLGKRILDGEVFSYYLSKRFGEFSLPKINIVKRNNFYGSFSEEFINSLKEVKEKKEQAIIFVPRRGFYPFVSCADCGELVKCKNCDVPMCVHVIKGKRVYVCHHCGYKFTTDPVCKKCSGLNFKQYGAGSQKITEELKNIFPDANVERIDSDSVNTYSKLKAVLKDILDGKIDFLVGTQIITKGLNFPKINFVGIPFLEPLTSIPDFRSFEKLYQLLVQVTGRAGRYSMGGKVVIQASEDQVPIIRKYTTISYWDFLLEELELRKDMFCPPFSYEVMFRWNGKLTEVKDEAKKFREILKEVYVLFENRDIKVTAPKFCPILRLHGNYRMYSLIRFKDKDVRKDFLEILLKRYSPKNKKIFIVDVDPLYYF